VRAGLFRIAALIIGGGRVLGVIELLNKADRGLFVTSDQTLLTLICRFTGELLFTLIRRDQESPGASEA